MSAALRVLLVGAGGRLGQAVATTAGKDPGLTITARLHRGEPIAAAIDECDVVIDFSTADATEAVCRACAEHGKPLVLGVTGHSPAQKDCLTAAAERIAIVFAANFSVGVNVLFALTKQAAKLLGDDFDPGVVEWHHR